MLNERSSLLALAFAAQEDLAEADHDGARRDEDVGEIEDRKDQVCV